MGYETDYTLTTTSPDADRAAAAALAVQEASGYGGWSTGSDGCTLYASKWYDWKDHLTAVSKKFPDVFFRLDGDGEEGPDIWAAFAYKGEVEQVNAQIMIKEPDWVVEIAPKLAAASETLVKQKRLRRIEELKAELAELEGETS